MSLDNFSFSFGFVLAEMSLVWGKKTDTGSGELVAVSLPWSVPCLEVLGGLGRQYLTGEGFSL